MNSPYTNDLWIDYKSPADGFNHDPAPTKSRLWFPKKASNVRRNAVASRKLGRRSQPRGAVRLHSTGRPQARRLGKVSLLAMVVAGSTGILATTASTGNVRTADFKAALLTTVAERQVPTPTFRFDDADSVASNEFQMPVLAAAANAILPGRPVSHGFAPLTVASMWPKSELVADDVALAPAQPTQKYESAPALADSTDVEVATPAPVVAAMTADPAALSPLANRLPSQDLAPLSSAPEHTLNKIDVVTVKSGDTFSGLLAKSSITKKQRRAILGNDMVKDKLSNLRIGTELFIEYKPDGELASINIKANRDTRIRINALANGEMNIASEHLPVEFERVVTSGTIEQSLYIAAEKANLKQSTIMALSDIFEWELDFARDIRKGDHFSMVYDRLYRDGKYIGDGDILAAEFIRGDRRYSAIRFTDDEGRTDYFSPDGQSKRRAFMRHPVDVVRITSRFDPNRLHPVLHKIRAHKGVDYGAPYGSPIYATADGRVAFSGSKNAYGNTVILKHGDNRSTLYAHMSKIAKSTKAGQRVKRGEVIGYVGKSGRVTGTHLHYEFRIAGKHVDPLKVELPSAPPLARQYHGQLKVAAQELFAQMQSVIPPEHERMAAID